MSEISVSNILPTRTRSGMRREVHSNVQPSVPQPLRPSSNPVQPSVPQPLRPASNPIQEREVFRMRAVTLYKDQQRYLASPGNREAKFKLMSEHDVIAVNIKRLVDNESKRSTSIQEIQEWIELICWHTRIAILNQSVCVA